MDPKPQLNTYSPSAYGPVQMSKLISQMVLLLSWMDGWRWIYVPICHTPAINPFSVCPSGSYLQMCRRRRCTFECNFIAVAMNVADLLLMCLCREGRETMEKHIFQRSGLERGELAHVFRAASDMHIYECLRILYIWRHVVEQRESFDRLLEPFRVGVEQFRRQRRWFDRSRCEVCMYIMGTKYYDDWGGAQDGKSHVRKHYYSSMIQSP